jgi:hypothetical protein
VTVTKPFMTMKPRMKCSLHGRNARSRDVAATFQIKMCIYVGNIPRDVGGIEEPFLYVKRMVTRYVFSTLIDKGLHYSTVWTGTLPREKQRSMNGAVGCVGLFSSSRRLRSAAFGIKGCRA